MHIKAILDIVIQSNIYESFLRAISNIYFKPPRFYHTGEGRSYFVTLNGQIVATKDSLSNSWLMYQILAVQKEN